MKVPVTLTHEFVRYIPDRPAPGVLYVSIEFATVVHRCACGCGNKVVTPLSPTDWHLVFDGESISLAPSVGNWGFACRSHYWVRGDQAQWIPRYTPPAAVARAGDLEGADSSPPAQASVEIPSTSVPRRGRRLRERLHRLFGG